MVFVLTSARRWVAVKDRLEEAAVVNTAVSAFVSVSAVVISLVSALVSVVVISLVSALVSVVVISLVSALVSVVVFKPMSVVVASETLNCGVSVDFFTASQTRLSPGEGQQGEAVLHEPSEDLEGTMGEDTVSKDLACEGMADVGTTSEGTADEDRTCDGTAGDDMTDEDRTCDGIAGDDMTDEDRTCDGTAGDEMTDEDRTGEESSDVDTACGTTPPSLSEDGGQEEQTVTGWPSPLEPPGESSRRPP